jgi:hypothetical protein
VLEMSLNSQFNAGWVLMQLAGWVVEEEMKKAAEEIATVGQ